ncbi:Zn-ribbon domain-containing OB-fold protein [Cupriavidus sp. 2TAF22]|uniref:Zn-ribbon domain-containing OB-fold protein n=1 Tax=unclassified Cupriavidus TaxID=2640874 RepID=UPI003F9049EB
MTHAEGNAPRGASEQPWQEQDGRLVLLAYRRNGGDTLHFPPLPLTSPQASDTELVALHGTPTLYSYTVMHPSPKTGLPPMPLGLADYPEGVRIFGRLVYPNGRRPAIGDTLRTCLVHTAEGPVYAFEPVSTEGSR